MRKKTFIFTLFYLVVFLSALFAQQTDFLKRLSGGSVQNNDFFEEIPFTFIDDRVCIRAKINDTDKEYSFILDTYAPCLIRESLVKNIPLDTLDLTELMGKQLEGSMMKPLFPLFQTIKLGNVILKDIGAMVMREDEDNPFFGVLEDGLIGANLLKCCIWQFDFQEKKIVMTDQSGRLDFLTKAIQVPFKPISIQQSPNVEVILNDTDKIEVQFDTGSKGFLNFSSPSVLSMVDSGDAVAVHRRSISPVKTTEGEIETYHLVKLKKMVIGGKDFYDLPAGVYQTDDTGQKARGSIGIEFMKSFIVTLDWPEKQIYLTERDDRGLKHNIRTFGMSYDFYDGAIRVASIYGDSAAEKKGLKIGDTIFEINGHRVDHLSEEQIKDFRHGVLRFSSESDPSISLIILNEGIEKKIELSSYLLFEQDDR